jgi:XTP/dITP diphosphohydrolase
MTKASQEKKVVLATTNRGKQRELRALFAGAPVELLLPEALPPVDEPGQTYAENAAHKARAAVRHTGSWALADDSGLEVEALGGRPGIHSARYAGVGADDAANRRKLLDELRERPPALRQARFVCVMALASPEGALHLVEGECRGRIALSEKGENGFGYDSLFFLPELGKHMAELADAEKNRLSHRARAAEKMIRVMRALF